MRRFGPQRPGSARKYQAYDGAHRRSGRRASTRSSGNCGGGSPSDGFDSAREGAGGACVGGGTSGGGLICCGTGGEKVRPSAGGRSRSFAEGEVKGRGEFTSSRSGRKGKLGTRGGVGTTCGGGGGSAVMSGDALALQGWEGARWTLDELIDSFEAGRSPRRLQYDADSGGSGPISPGRVASFRGSGEGTVSGGGSEDAAAANWRSDLIRDRVDLMRERVVQLKRAIKEGRLKPISNGTLQVYFRRFSCLPIGTDSTLDRYQVDLGVATLPPSQKVDPCNTEFD